MNQEKQDKVKLYFTWIFIYKELSFSWTKIRVGLMGLNERGVLGTKIHNKLSTRTNHEIIWLQFLQELGQVFILLLRIFSVVTQEKEDLKE